ncbi:MAG: hypothetical protein ABI878_07865 [Acidobacteriota bacterium]
MRVVSILFYFLVLEILTLPAAMLTMGHAGPEGSFAIFGWIGLLANFPGFIIAGRLGPLNSEINFAICVFFVQLVLVVGSAFLYRTLKNERRRV